MAFPVSLLHIIGCVGKRHVFLVSPSLVPLWNSDRTDFRHDTAPLPVIRTAAQPILLLFAYPNLRWALADESKIGKIWQDDELDAIVADYFEMLKAELGGQKYRKAAHSTALMEKIGRTHRSVEFKHQNISAVLDELGMPWIAGYIPKRNYQNAIFGAIDRYLSQSPELMAFVPSAREEAVGLASFVDPPVLREAEDKTPEGLRRLVRKFDPVQRDFRNRALGMAGEELVVGLERARLLEMNRRDLAHRVRWVAVEDGDGAGFDVRSFDVSGRERLIEVKTTNGSARTPFFLSRNERAMSEERPADWCLYRVHEFSKRPRIFQSTPPLERSATFQTETWKVSFS